MTSAPSKPRLLALFTMGWAIRNYAHSDFFERLRSRYHVTVALRRLSPPVIDLLAPRTDALVEVPDVRMGSFAHASEVLMWRAFQYRFMTECFQFKRSQAWRRAESLAKRAKLAFIESSGWLISRVGYDKGRAIEEWLLDREYRGGPAETLLEDVRPDVVFSTMPHHFVEAPLVRLAKKRRIVTTTAILSWDNIVTKDRMPITFDRYFVWSELMARDLRRFYPETMASSVTITGAPQFDMHVRGDKRISRQNFCAELGLDPTRPIVTYVGTAAGAVPDDEWIAAQIAAGFEAQRVPGNPQLLVRLHPLDSGERFAGLAKRGVSVLRSWEHDKSQPTWSLPSTRDIDLLWGTLAHTAVSVNFNSTMSLDFALFDCPVVNLAFQTPATTAGGIDVARFLRYEHFRPVLEEKASRLAVSPEGILEAVAAYLQNPAADRDSRKRLVARVCGPMDGRAGDRIAEELLAL